MHQSAHIEEVYQGNDPPDRKTTYYSDLQFTKLFLL